MTDVLMRCMAGEPIRIWYSDNADELCGLYWFMALIYFRGAPCDKIYLVKLPAWEYDEQKQTVLQKNSWGDVAPGEWHTYVSLQSWRLRFSAGAVPYSGDPCNGKTHLCGL